MISAVFAAALLAASAPVCTPLEGTAPLWAEGVRYVLVGEIHGTREIPQAVADLVCDAARTRPVVVALEAPPAATQAALDAYLRSDGAPQDRAALLAPAFWADRSGRSSEAVAELVEQVRRLRAAGRKVELVAFDPVAVPAGTSGPREAGLADALAAAAARRPDAVVIALTGSGHAAREPFTSYGAPFPSAAQLLPPAQTLSLAVARPGGEAWNCRAPQPGEPACKTQALPVREPAPTRGVRLDPTLRPGFDGVLSTGGPYTASPPARPGPATS